MSLLPAVGVEPAGKTLNLRPAPPSYGPLRERMRGRSTLDTCGRRYF